MRRKIILATLIIASTTAIGRASRVEAAILQAKTTAGVISELDEIVSSCLQKVEEMQKTQTVTRYTTCSLNVREYPNTDSDIITVLDFGDEVEVVYIDNSKWCKILYEDKFYFVYSEYLSEEQLNNRWNISLTSDEIDLLAKIVYLEANTQSLYGQEAVVEIIFNRIANGYWGDTLYDVLSASGQFVTWSNRNLATPTDSNYEAIYNVLYGQTNIFSEDYLYFSKGGHSNHSDCIIIEDHQFCTK